MGWTFATDVEEYAQQVLPLLSGAPDVHCAALGVITDARARMVPAAAELFGWWVDDNGRVAGAVSVSPPDPPLVEVVPEAAVASLVEQLVALGQVPHGVTGPTEVAVSFAAHAAEQLGLVATLDHVMVQYRAERVARPDPPPAGRARPAQEADVAQLRRWVRAAVQESMTSSSDESAAQESGPDVLDGAYWVWEDRDGKLVSLAAHSPPAWGVARVGPVYTPPSARGRGYAAGVTYEVTSTLLTRGVGAVLFTDLVTPAPNRLYRRLGYRPVAQWVSLILR